MLYQASLCSLQILDVCPCSGVATGVARGAECHPWQQKFANNREKEGKNQEKSEKNQEKNAKAIHYKSIIFNAGLCSQN